MNLDDRTRTWQLIMTGNDLRRVTLDTQADMARLLDLDPSISHLTLEIGDVSVHVARDWPSDQYVLALAIIAASACQRSGFLLTLSANGVRHRAQINCQRARHRPALLAIEGFCSRYLPMGSLNPSTEGGFANWVSRTVLTNRKPQNVSPVLPAGRIVRKEGFAEPPDRLLPPSCRHSTASAE
ncbi:hypothetical protein [Sphingobium xenophagum]|uniref:hypothetical protein n=1 Tax=Sphingobium xenophagum TaxID=121428 RepID=UPI0012FA22A2|nr:hypothetical protein [Sphingobium xenophagum]